ncbi:hypothetical protein SOVF_043840 [Spinacia oleracea]|nr:hypothetical protein SOVF_043840 [Spinacia oleracea]
MIEDATAGSSELCDVWIGVASDLLTLRNFAETLKAEVHEIVPDDIWIKQEIQGCR